MRSDFYLNNKQFSPLTGGCSERRSRCVQLFLQIIHESLPDVIRKQMRVTLLFIICK